MSIELLFSLSFIFGITAVIAYIRRDWGAFNFCTFVTFFAALGFLFRLLA
jgi:hypothetical protein